MSRDPLLKRIAPLILRCYAVLASVSRCYSTLEGRLVTCYSPGRHFTHGLLHFLVRLACVRHAASVDSEPGSNSRLKPDAYRRVEGRLPSPGSKAGMAPPLSLLLLASCEAGKKKFTVVYLVRSFELILESVSHDWHVQPSCQRPNRGPPKRREFSPGGVAARANRLSSKPCKHTLRYRSRQSSLPTGFPDVFHIGSVLGRGGGRAASQNLRFLASLRNDRDSGGASEYAQQYGLPSGARRHFRCAFCAARYGRQKIEKRSFWRSLL